MCLHDMLCGSLGVIKFDSELVVLYFFENLLFLLILKCFVHYLVLLLTIILACDMLWFAYFKEVVPLHLPWLVFSSVCLRISNGLSMEEFGKCLKCIILGSFCYIFRENYMLYVIIYAPFPVLRSGMVLFYVLQNSGSLTLDLTHK